jgi:replication factor C small subunit
MSVINDLFTEKFRPKDLSSLIIVPRIREELSKGLIQNILLYSITPGVGKSSASRILSKNYITKYVDATTDGKVHIIESIDKFCSTISLEGGRETIKCVVIEELGGSSSEFMMSMLPLIEKHAKNARFIGSINYINKLPEPLLSRFHCINFEPINKEEEDYLISEYKKRLGAIFNAAKINFSEEILNKFIMNDFPDMRSMLNKVQSLYLRNVKELNDKNFNINFDFVNLFKLTLNKPDKPYENYKFIISEYSSKIDDAMSSFGGDFINFLKENEPNKIDKIPQIMICVAEYQYQINFVIDKLVCLLAMVYKLQIILNS